MIVTIDSVATVGITESMVTIIYAIAIGLGTATTSIVSRRIGEKNLESVFVIVDIYFVSKLGANAVATVGITESMVTIIYAIAIGLGTATTSIVSRRIGEKNPDAASVAAFQAILTGMVVSILIGLP